MKAYNELESSEVNKINDTEIIKMLFERNEKALEIIQEQFGKLIRRISMNIFNNIEYANECLNDVLLDVWNSIPPTSPLSVASYVCMLSRRRTIDVLRKENADKRKSTDYKSVEIELAAIDDGLDDLIDSVNITQILNVFLADISVTNREIFISRYYDFESIKSISTRLHMTENSVNTRLTRMREKLKKELLTGGICV